MKYVLSVLAIASTLSVAATTQAGAAEVVDRYTSGNYGFTCIMKSDDLKYGGNWNVVSG